MFMLVGLACREPQVGPDRLLVETFETNCDGTPCGWTRVDGSASDVRFVQTIHPGEHGLSIAAGASARGPMGANGMVSIQNASLQLRASARCDRGAQLVVEAALADRATRAADTFEGRASPPSVWDDTVEVITITANQALNDGGLGGNVFGGGGTILDIEVLGLILRVDGEGTCEIDQLTLDAVASGAGTRPEWC